MSNPQKTHLAGIVPVAGVTSDLDLKTPEVLLPLNVGYTAIQKSVYECAIAGCNTIWIVANDDLAPVIRSIVGEWIHDPVYYKTGGRFNSEQRRETPIYYVPIHPKDRDRRDSYGWSVLYGAYSAWKTASQLSKWITPNKYYVSFPMSVYDVESIRAYRKEIKQQKTNFFLRHDGETVKNNKPIAFTFTGEDFKQCRRHINHLTTREYLPPSPGSRYPSEKLPIAERWSARQFSLQTVFEKTAETSATHCDLDWCYDLSSWSGYRDFLASDFSIETPPKHLTTAHKHVKMLYESEK